MRRTLALVFSLALLGCRAFPVGLYVPDEVLDALESARFEEELDPETVARAIETLAGRPVAPAEPAAGRYWRLDAEPELGPLAPADCARPGTATEGLASGDLVLVKNPRAQSLATTLAFAAFTFHDHLGVLVERDGAWLVCDSWPSFHPLAKAADFADRFRGGVRATPLPAFLAHYETLAFVRLPDAAANARLAAAALASLDEAIEFDPHHDPADPRLSCSEYVELLLERAGIPAALRPRALTSDAELRRALAALGFPAGGFLAPDDLAALPGARQVACLSRHRTRAGAQAVELAFELLHARFARDGHVADFLAVDRFRFLRYRANVALFLAFAEGWAEARGVAERATLEEELRPLLPVFFRAR